ncbi:MAG: TonB-dependent receptor [Acidobacteria bacterium]|nr:TonB-dependent receptor [Acidobacteriota bacterium]
MSAGRLFLCVAAAAALVLPVHVYGQSSQSALAGVVKDSTGAVLPGVTVEAASPALIERVRSVTTDSSGLYRIVDLRPGVYTVTFTLAGFSTVRVENFELRADFTATVNADLKVGELAETISVTGEAPLVDVQSTTRSAVFNREALENLPNNRLIQSLAQTIPGVVGGLNIDGPASRTLTVHGSRSAETNSAIDGMSDRRGSNGGVAVTFYMNEGSVQEVSVRTDGGDAEAQYSGVWMNAIPKEGANVFNWNVTALYANKSMAGSNLSQDYINQGLTAVNGLKRTWDVNPNGGGPLMEDKLWFYVAYRNNDIDKYVADHFYNTDPLAWVYVPDKTRQGSDEQIHRNYAWRLTWQATPRNKLNFSYEKDRRITSRRRAAANVSPEATTYTPFYPNAIWTAVWRVPVNNRLLFDTGFMAYEQDWDERRQIDPKVGFDVISVTEDSTGQIYRASTVYGHNFDNPLTMRSSLAYVTGTHSFKSGFMMRVRGNGPTYNNTDVNGSMNFNFLNGVPRRVTLYATPIEQHNDIKADLGLFAQDSWAMRRMTINYGVRFDYLNAAIPAQHLAAGPFVPERNFAPVKNVPNWKDVNPRLGVSYDLFGNGRTVVKGTVGRYISGGSLATNVNPVNTSINQATRAWTDTNRNFFPDCDWNNSAANSECGPLSNLNFGRINPRATQFDREVLEGWGVRPYNWSVGAGVQRQIASGASVDVSYYRRWYGNFTVVDNQLVGPEDYDPFCVTGPRNDARLPTAGQQICGYYDIKPAKNGLSENLVRLAKHYGNQTEIYNGVDASVNWRVRGLTLFAGLSTGRTSTSQCFVVDAPVVYLTVISPATPTATNPQSPMSSCKVVPPFLTQYKGYGVYQLPWWGVSVSGTFQAVPQPATGGAFTSITADYVATSAEIRPSLGRDLAAGANGTATLELLKPFALLGGHTKELDMRVGKLISSAGRTRVRVSLDIYNVLNSNDWQTITTRLSSNAAANRWQRPTLILQARYVQIGTQIDF